MTLMKMLDCLEGKTPGSKQWTKLVDQIQRRVWNKVDGQIVQNALHDDFLNNDDCGEAAERNAAKGMTSEEWAREDDEAAELY